MPREGFVKACGEDEISSNSLVVLLLSGVEVLLARVGGKIFATSARCRHKGCSLGEGWLDRGHLVCGCHLSKYDLESGRVVDGPANHPFQVFEVLVEDRSIWVKLG